MYTVKQLVRLKAPSPVWVLGDNLYIVNTHTSMPTHLFCRKAKTGLKWKQFSMFFHIFFQCHPVSCNKKARSGCVNISSQLHRPDMSAALIRCVGKSSLRSTLNLILWPISSTYFAKIIKCAIIFIFSATTTWRPWLWGWGMFQIMI